MSAEPRIAVVGDVLLDRDVEGTVERLCPDAPVPVVDRTTERARPGGAGLAAALAAVDGNSVALVTALGADAAGEELRALLAARGVELVDLGLAAATPEKQRVLVDGRPLLRIDRGERRPEGVGAATDAARCAIAEADAVLVSDYGRGVAAEPGVRAALAAAAGSLPIAWDPHTAGPDPVLDVALATPNRMEAGVPSADVAGAARAARALLARWRCRAVAVTLGADGALLLEGDGQPALAPAPGVSGGDPCGAGDRFASRAVGLLAAGASTRDAVTAAVAAASGFVDAGGAVTLREPEAPAAVGGQPRRPGGAVELAARERAAGRRVVATGGCFDLLHAGHVGMLRAARALGDVLVVCLNSDCSVRTLKGAGRPLVAQDERAAVLEALECVDAVLVFDEPTPIAAIERVRPDVWVKGGDYAGERLEEADAVEAHGGEVVLVPYLRGRSTTRLIEEAVHRHAA